MVEQLSQYATSQSSANLLNNEATRYLTGQLNQGFASVRVGPNQCPHATHILLSALLHAPLPEKWLTGPAMTSAWCLVSKR